MKKKTFVAAVWVLLIMYSSVLLYIVFAAARRRHAEAQRFREFLNLVPIRNKIIYISGYQHLSAHSIREFYLNIVGNIFLFAPMPVFISLLTRSVHYRLLILIPILVSICIETMQYVTGVGVTDIDDVIFNAIGALLGSMIARAVQPAIRF